jgi:hypothetical protein
MSSGEKLGPGKAEHRPDSNVTARKRNLNELVAGELWRNLDSSESERKRDVA